MERASPAGGIHRRYRGSSSIVFDMDPPDRHLTPPSKQKKNADFAARIEREGFPNLENRRGGERANSPLLHSGGLRRKPAIEATAARSQLGGGARCDVVGFHDEFRGSSHGQGAHLRWEYINDDFLGEHRSIMTPYKPKFRPVAGYTPEGGATGRGVLETAADGSQPPLDSRRGECANAAASSSSSIQRSSHHRSVYSHMMEDDDSPVNNTQHNNKVGSRSGGVCKVDSGRSNSRSLAEAIAADVAAPFSHPMPTSKYYSWESPMQYRSVSSNREQQPANNGGGHTSPFLHEREAPNTLHAWHMSSVGVGTPSAAAKRAVTPLAASISEPANAYRTPTNGHGTRSAAARRGVGDDDAGAHSPSPAVTAQATARLGDGGFDMSIQQAAVSPFEASSVRRRPDTTPTADGAGEGDGSFRRVTTPSRPTRSTPTPSRHLSTYQRTHGVLAERYGALSPSGARSDGERKMSPVPAAAAASAHSAAAEVSNSIRREVTSNSRRGAEDEQPAAGAPSNRPTYDRHRQRVQHQPSSNASTVGLLFLGDSSPQPALRHVDGPKNEPLIHRNEHSDPTAFVTSRNSQTPTRTSRRLVPNAPTSNTYRVLHTALQEVPKPFKPSLRTGIAPIPELEKDVSTLPRERLSDLFNYRYTGR